MYTSFYGMSTNPFMKEESSKNPYISNDYKETTSRLNYLKEVKGIGVFCGTSGLGKTYTIRSFINSLNKDLYKVIYINTTSRMSTFDFYKIVIDALGLDVGACYRADIYHNIQKEIMRIVNQDKMGVIVIIDEAHFLSKDIIQELKVFYDFEIDSKDYVSLVLVGYSELKNELLKTNHKTFRERIIVNYEFQGLSREEVKEYVRTRLEIANSNKDIFSIEALNALYSCSKSSPRRLNTLVLNSLMLGAEDNKVIIEEETIMLAKGEMDLM